MAETHILIVDDQEIFRNLLDASLRCSNYRVTTACNGQVALQAFAAASIDLVLVDVMMPEMNGYAFCAELRKTSDVPIIMLTSLDSPDDILYGYSLGADDYIVKPFRFREVEVRIQALLRRVALVRDRAAQNIVSAGVITLDLKQSCVTIGRQTASLTAVEAQLLCHLLQAPAHRLTRRQLFQQTWGYAGRNETQLVEYAIRQLRAKLEPDPTQPRYLLSEHPTLYRLQPT